MNRYVCPSLFGGIIEIYRAESPVCTDFKSDRSSADEL
jgi:hypothetical protein